MWTKVLRSKLEYEKSGRAKRQNEVSKDDVTTDGGTEMQSTSAASTDYIPPWFNRYIEYKFNLLDRAGQISQSCVVRFQLEIAYIGGCICCAYAH